MSENSNPFRRPYSARAAPTTSVDETLFDSILGLQDHRESVPQTSPKASRVGGEGGAADRKPQTKPPPPPPPAPRRRGTRKIYPATPNLASSHVGESSHESLSSPSPSSPSLSGPHSVESRPPTSRLVADITNPPSNRSPGDTTSEFAGGLTRSGSTVSLDATSELTIPSSYDLGSRLLDPPASLERESSARIKPSPPKPRARSGVHIITQTPGNVSSATSKQESVSTEFTPSLALSDQAASIAGPELATVPKDASFEIEKRVPPPPPLSRRVSVRVSVAPVQKGRPKSMLPPPPPPIRKASGSVNRSSWHGSGPRSDVNSPGSLALDPTFPSGYHLGPVSSLHDGNIEVEVAPLSEGSRGDMDNDVGGNILVGLEALKREVEELRGKYDAKNVPSEP